MMKQGKLEITETLKKLLWTLRCVKMSQPGAGGHVAGHVVCDDDVVVVVQDLPLLITSKHQKRFDLKSPPLIC